LSSVFGLAVGRSLLFRADDDVEAAVDGAIAMLEASGGLPAS